MREREGGGGGECEREREREICSTNLCLLKVGLSCLQWPYILFSVVLLIFINSLTVFLALFAKG